MLTKFKMNKENWEEQVAQPLRHEFGEVWYQLLAQLWMKRSVGTQVQSRLWSSVELQIRNQTFEPIRDQVQKNLGELNAY